MLSPALPANASLATSVSRERILLRVLNWMSILVIAGLVAAFGASIIARNALTPVEGIVAIHSHMLAGGKGLYYNFNHYPFTVSPYGPIFYGFSALLELAGLPIYAGGRLISFAALLGALWSASRIVKVLAPGNPFALLTGFVLTGACANTLYWGTTGQVDILAIAFSIGAFERFLHWRNTRAGGFWTSALLVVLAVYTKQTALAAGAAIALTLLREDWKLGLRWIGVTAGAGLSILLALDIATRGQHLQNAIFANLNPFSIDKLIQQAQYFGLTAGGLLLVVLCGWRAVTKRTYPLFLYTAIASVIWLLTAPKVGSDLNYQIEMTLGLAVAAALVLEESGFFQAVIENRKTWVTMLQIPLLLFVGLNLTLTVRTVAERGLLDSLTTKATNELRPYLGSHKARVLGGSYDTLRQLRGSIEVETLIYTLLVDAGRIDPTPVLKDIEAGRFDTILLPIDLAVTERPDWLNDEVNPLPKSHLNAIRKRYRLVKHLDGAFLNGDYIYEPIRP
jgi:hypothetical protein